MESKIEIITLNEAIQKIKNNPYECYVIKLDEKYRLCLCELDFVEDILDGYIVINFIEE